MRFALLSEPTYAGSMNRFSLQRLIRYAFSDHAESSNRPHAGVKKKDDNTFAEDLTEKTLIDEPPPQPVTPWLEGPQINS